MTVTEAYETEIYKIFIASADMTLQQVCYLIYKEVTTDLMNALVLVNKWYDFACFSPGTEVRYFTKQLMSQIK